MIPKYKHFILGTLSPSLTTNFYITESSSLKVLKSYSILWEGSFTIWEDHVELLDVCLQTNISLFSLSCLYGSIICTIMKIIIRRQCTSVQLSVAIFQVIQSYNLTASLNNTLAYFVLYIT